MNENDPFAKQDKKADESRDAKGRFGEGNPGGQKGRTNKFTDLKKAFIEVFEKIETESEQKDSIDSFYSWATKNTKNQGEFYKMLSKMLPSNLDVTLPTDTVIKVISAVPRPAETAAKPEEKK